MKQLSYQEVEAKLADMDQASANGDTPEWRAFHRANRKQPVVITLGGSQMMNPALHGALHAWSRLSKISPLRWPDDTTGLSVQGIEQVFDVETNLMDALLAASMCGITHISIRLS